MVGSYSSSAFFLVSGEIITSGYGGEVGGVLNAKRSQSVWLVFCLGLWALESIQVSFVELEPNLNLRRW